MCIWGRDGIRRCASPSPFPFSLDPGPGSVRRHRKEEEEVYRNSKTVIWGRDRRCGATAKKKRGVLLVRRNKRE